MQRTAYLLLARYWLQPWVVTNWTWMLPNTPSGSIQGIICQCFSMSLLSKLSPIFTHCSYVSTPLSPLWAALFTSFVFPFCEGPDFTLLLVHRKYMVCWIHGPCSLHLHNSSRALRSIYGTVVKKDWAQLGNLSKAEAFSFHWQYIWIT